MNEERILELADYVEGLEHENESLSTHDKYNQHQARPFHMDHCKQCLIGQTGVLFTSVASMAFKFWNSYEAAEVLGLDEDVSKKLFFPSMYADGIGAMKEVTPKVAAEVLRNFVDTGKIEWPRYEPGVDSILSDSYHEFDLSDD